MLSIRNVVVLVSALGLTNVALAADPTQPYPPSPTPTNPAPTNPSSTTHPATPSSHETANDQYRAGDTMSDAQIANTLAMIAQAEIDQAKFVESRTTNSDVKKLAQQRDDDFSAALKKTQDWMKKNNITSTPMPSSTASAQTGTSNPYGSSSQTAGANPTPSTSSGQVGAAGQYGGQAGASGQSGMSGQTGATGQTGTSGQYGSTGQYGATGQNGSTSQSGATSQSGTSVPNQCPPGMYMAASGCEASTPGTNPSGMYGNNGQATSPTPSPYGSNGTNGTQYGASGTQVGQSQQDMARQAQQELADLQKLSGAELDRRYVAAAVNDDQRLLDQMDTRYLLQVKDQDLKTVVKDARSKVSSDLDAARRAQTNLVEKPKTSGTR